MKPSLNSLRPHLAGTLDRTHLRTPVLRGKVRDLYPLGEEVLFICTDRLTGFDRFLTRIPLKGSILNQTSSWWFSQTEHLIPNHFLHSPAPAATVARRCEMLPLEFVVRGYLTGTTDTSLWTHYAKGIRRYCDQSIPDGLRKNDPLPVPILTPTTKSKDHDRPIGEAEILSSGLISPADWEVASSAALALFRFGSEVAAERGLVLVDTKYEFGKLPDGTIILADEIHTPDSSRYWIASTLEERLSQGLEPENIDKEIIRLWYREHCDPYVDVNLPKLPDELILELSARYLQLFAMITGQPFPLPAPTQDPEAVLAATLRAQNIL
ncbi:MAG: phosphoribosylaminoimidazolesuccinocarboxamide synthase [Puniceicoccaceae bacterium]